jgi:DNA helicase-2/ATP-dependent DNA helicase PcrA
MVIGAGAQVCGALPSRAILAPNDRSLSPMTTQMLSIESTRREMPRVQLPQPPAAPAMSALVEPDYLATLNADQRRAVEHAGDAAGSIAGPLLIIAGAGSGKTNTLAYRVAHLVRSGADPHRILLLTFSRRAAVEMERRAGQILARVLGLAAQDRASMFAWAGTFHSVGARLLRDYAPRIGLRDSFTVHDRGDCEDMLALLRHDLGLTATKARFPNKATCGAIYSRVVNSQASLADVLRTTFPWCANWEVELKTLFSRYVAEKQSQNVLDYDDLLLYWSHAMADAQLASDAGGRFDHVLVDEYQDTNRLQAAILVAMKPDGRGVTVVGDDAQSIYSFRAATVRNILDFPRQFAQPAQVVLLERNYRSTQPILAASNAVIEMASERFTKQLWSERASSHKPQLITVADETDQARCVAENILGYCEAGVALKSQAVLFRSSSHSAQLELELGRRGIPFVKYGGLKFLEAAHVKDMLCVLRWAENPRSRMAGFRVARLLPGVGPATATRLLDTMGERPDPVAAMRGFAPGANAVADWDAFIRMFTLLHAGTAGWPAELELIGHWYEPHLQRVYDDAVIRQRDLAQLQQIAATYATRERFLTELTLDPPSATSDEAGPPSRDDDYLVLSTIHSAKGQEWKTVHVLNVVDGCIPSDMGTGTTEEIDEERRLLYVAMTRAKDHLHLVVPQRFYAHQQAQRGDRHVYASRTRFIPRSMAPLFELATWPATAPLPSAAVCRDAPGIDVVARIKAFWE